MRPLLAAFCIGAVACVASCGQTTEKAALEPTSGGRVAVMLTHVDQLQPGQSGQAALRYVNPNVNWASYTKMIIQPVTFWTGTSNAADDATQQLLCDYLANALHTALASDIELVSAPGPHTMVLRVALTDISASDPGLRTISVVVPQARLLSAVGSSATGSVAFAGSVQAEFEMTDSLTGVRLAAAIDRRQGGSSFDVAGGGKWDDARAVMDYWADLMRRRLATVRGGA